MIRLISRKNLPARGELSVSRSPEVMATIFRSLPEQKQFLLHVPVLVLGDSRAGKTSTVKSLTGKQFDESQAKTHGVETVTVKNEEGNWKTIADSDVFNYELMRSKLVADLTGNLCEDQTYKKYRLILLRLFTCLSTVTGLQNNDLFKAVISCLLLFCLIFTLGLFWSVFFDLTLLLFLELVTSYERRNANVTGLIFFIYGILLGTELGFNILSPISNLLSHFSCGQILFVVLVIFLAEITTQFFHCFVYESRAPLALLNCLHILDLKSELHQILHGGILGGVLTVGMSSHSYKVQGLICCILLSALLIHRKQISVTTISFVVIEFAFLGAMATPIIWPSLSACSVSGVCALFFLVFTPLVVGYSNWATVKQHAGVNSFVEVLLSCDPVFAEAQKMLFIPEIMQDVNNAILSPKQSILDFAGDEDYYIYHHLFLSPESIYFVVFDIQSLIKDNFEAIKEKIKRLHFWLESICTHTPLDTPIFIVGTHLGMTSSDVLKRLNDHLTQELWDKFCDSIITNDHLDLVYFPIENSLGSDGKPINVLRQAVDQAVNKLTENLENNVPLSWIKLSGEILKLQKSPQAHLCVTLEEFKQMCMESGVPVEQTKEVLHYLHQHRLVVYFPCGVLSEWVLLQPQLLVNVIINLVKPPPGTDKKRGFRRYWNDLNTKGFLAEPLLDHILASFGEDTKAMKAFLEASDLICKLSHPLQETSLSSPVKYSHFLPQMLPMMDASATSPIWNSSPTDSKFYIFFERFLPAALFHHLQSRTYKQSRAECPGCSPVLRRHDGVFWLSKQQPIKITLLEDEGLVEVVFSRVDRGLSAGNVLSLVWHMIDSICRQHFKHLHFHCGPLCPSNTCPGDPDRGNFPSPRRHVFNVLPARQNRSQIDLKCCNQSFELELRQWIP